MIEFEPVFIVGAGRSGTTWLHLMLGAHKDIATGQESQLFEKYLKGLYEQWVRELNFAENTEVRKHGITSYVSGEQFIGLLRHFALSVFENVLRAKPGATIFLEKSPNNSWNIDLIIKCFPDARFIHVIRDGRDVVASMLAAKDSWGHQWAPAYAAEAAVEWRDAVTESQRLQNYTSQYCEVRYEKLLDSGPTELQGVLEFLAVPLSLSKTREIYDRFSFDKLKGDDYTRDIFLNPGEAKASGTSDRPEPEGFFRKGISGDWKQSLTTSQLEEVYWEAGELLATLGYSDLAKPVNKMPRSIKIRNLRRVLKEKIGRLGKKALG